MNCSYDLAVVGAGPAGVAAAIQAKRQGLRVLLFEHEEVGGAARSANWLENLPGHPRGISGLTFAKKLEEQLNLHGLRIVRRRVCEICRRNQLFEMDAGGKLFASRAAIVACGLEGKRLEIPGEVALADRMVPYPIPSKCQHAGKRILVIGGGDTAFDQAIGFSRRARKVTIAMRGEGPRAIPCLVKKARKEGVLILMRHTPLSVENSNGSVNMIFGFKNGRRAVMADFVSLCIGKERRPGLLWPKICSGADGFALAGDCNIKNARHVAVAAGDGIAKAMALAEYVGRINGRA